MYSMGIMENWKPVIGFEDIYEVSDFGRVRSKNTEKIKNLTIGSNGRPYLGLWNKNRQKIVKPHTLVLEAFVEKRPHGMECCHNDGNPQNNNLSNLRWDTSKNNHADKIKHGTTNRGERCGTAKLTEQQVFEIRKDNRLQREIAVDYGVAANTISRIKNRKRWAYS